MTSPQRIPDADVVSDSVRPRREPETAIGGRFVVQKLGGGLSLVCDFNGKWHSFGLEEDELIEGYADCAPWSPPHD